MSKELEKEYRVLVNSEVPDLWERIEAGLDEKITADSNIVDMTVLDKRNTLDIRKFLDIKKFLDKRKIRVWASLAAVCLCVALIVPVMKNRMGGRANDMAAAPRYTNDAPQSGGDDDDAPQPAGDNGKAGATLSGSFDAGAGDGAAYDAAANNTAVVTNGEAAEVAEEEGEYTFQAEVEILGVDLGGAVPVVYTAKVLSSENPDLKEDSEITIVISVAQQEYMEMLEKGGIYDLTLCSDSSGREMTYGIVYYTGMNIYR